MFPKNKLFYFLLAMSFCIAQPVFSADAPTLDQTQFKAPDSSPSNPKEQDTNKSSSTIQDITGLQSQAVKEVYMRAPMSMPPVHEGDSDRWVCPRGYVCQEDNGALQPTTIHSASNMVCYKSGDRLFNSGQRGFCVYRLPDHDSKGNRIPAPRGGFIGQYTESAP